MRISLHDTAEIKISKVREAETEEGKKFFTRKFCFIDMEGNEVELTAFAKSGGVLKTK